MTQDPGSSFGHLLTGCISDRYLSREKLGAAEGLIFLLLGLGSSFATSYLLSAAGILV